MGQSPSCRLTRSTPWWVAVLYSSAAAVENGYRLFSASPLTIFPLPIAKMSHFNKENLPLLLYRDTLKTFNSRFWIRTFLN